MDTPASPRLLLAACLQEGRVRMGEILLGSDYTLRHADDEGRDDLILHTAPTKAREIARYDERGEFRPLKSAPNLSRGWLLETGYLEGMELALEFFYPSALGLWFAFLKATLQVTSLRETLGRQTGMYRITQLLTDNQAQDLAARCCSSEGGCLRTVLWRIAPDQQLTSLPASKLSLESLPANRIPLLCREPCNLMVAAARPIAKANLPR
jgi:sirohydrochlorin cobaltochelatase